ncbi:MAG: hypothetical protein A3K19_05125 [Lentisphaerae bacterium RIFOXYB12_FULL_65_16]|nr:MAG: hypothetical protein A3K18_35225 [Lentisphaerae bacterium RIFOXYA12_64_32]OGV89770.1 MAG: hypothetical protein A3K19_05125 [Lentisphaerae bacterium RIFOXYB12_FULL_65_16]
MGIDIGNHAYHLGQFAVALLLTVATARRVLCALEPNPACPVPSDRFLRTTVLAALLLIAATAAAGFCGILNGAGILAMLTLGLLLSLRLNRTGAAIPDAIEAPARTFPVEWILPALFHIALILACLPLTPSSWDAMTYHLYIPCRWVQEQHIFHVPTVFGDNAAAFAPKNAAVLTAALLALLNTDCLCNCVDLLFLLFAGVCVYRLARLLGAAPGSSRLGAALFCCFPFLCLETYSAKTDLFTLAFLLGGAYWLALYLQTRKPMDGAFCLLSTGLALGAKTAALPFAAIVVLGFVVTATVNRHVHLLVAALPLLLLSGGAWYVGNWLLYGNPLFPLGLPGLNMFPGAYDAAAVRAGEFHAATLGQLARAVLNEQGILTVALAGLGLAGILYGLAEKHGDRRADLAVAGTTIAWTVIYVWGIPHNLETRFLLPAIALAAAGMALATDRAGSPRVVYAIGILAMALFGIPLLQHACRSARLLPRPLLIADAAVLVGAAVGIALWLKRTLPTRTALVALAATALLVTLSAMGASAQLRPVSLLLADYTAVAPVYLRFNQPAPAGPPPTTIAYAGLNLPYTLVGDRMRNKVVYCNVRKGLNAGFFDFWKDEKRTYAYHKPGIYRDRPDKDAWVRNLRQAGAQVLVVFRMRPVERQHLEATPEGYPIEDAWAAETPQIFSLRDTADWGKIYAVTPDDGPGPEPR